MHPALIKRVEGVLEKINNSGQADRIYRKYGLLN
jgi:hypothetical protein